MFNWLKRRKSIKILVVVNNDAHEPLDYKNKIDVDIKTEVRVACNALAIEYSESLIDVISTELKQNGYYYLALGYGFEVIEVDVD